MTDLRSEAEDTPYTINNGVLFWQDRVFIPNSLRHAVLQELQSTHVGVTKMKQLARRYVYCERIDQDIEQLVKS